MTLPDISTKRLRATTLARKWKLDVDLSPAQDGSDWRRLMGQTDCTVNTGTAGMQPDSDYDGEGFTSQSATSQDHGFNVTVRRATTQVDGTKYDDAQEWLRGKARGTGQDNTAHVRAYEYSGPNGPLVEAYEGFYGIAWANSGGAFDALSMATITGTGQGILLPIAHPAGIGTAAAPAVTAVRYDGGGSSTPAAGGGLVIVSGSGFQAATAVVVFGATVPAADWTPVSDTVLVFKAPAHAAGTGDVVVTNSGGTSGTSGASKVTYA